LEEQAYNPFYKRDFDASVRRLGLYTMLIRVDEVPTYSTFDCSSGGSAPRSVVLSRHEEQSR
jgi:hypothetical protein